MGSDSSLSRSLREEKETFHSLNRRISSLHSALYGAAASGTDELLADQGLGLGALVGEGTCQM